MEKLAYNRAKTVVASLRARLATNPAHFPRVFSHRPPHLAYGYYSYWVIDIWGRP